MVLVLLLPAAASWGWNLQQKLTELGILLLLDQAMQVLCMLQGPQRQIQLLGVILPACINAQQLVKHNNSAKRESTMRVRTGLAPSQQAALQILCRGMH